ncbi:MAG: hypothetical protein HY428_01405, partial [Candidatus Levybacteria bacterium]|nr:hypothetical protein [Candidatus Levybacteria bacterium]
MKLDGIRERVFLDRYSLKDKAGNPVEKDPWEMWKRVAKGIASVEKPKDRKIWEKKFYDVMEGFKFLPGGRILAGAGTGYDVTYFNCFVIPSPKDSRDGILDNLKSMIEIMARGGGVGLNLSSLRPKGSRVKKVNGFSSGPINWAELYSLATHDIVQQGGSRRGALMLMLWDWHPDIEEFITVKQDLSRINGANLSVCISDSFMEAVKKDSSWDLVYPDLDNPRYDELWDGDIQAWKKAGGKVVVKKTVKAKYLWDMICAAAWRSAEPGLHFLERSNKRSNTFYFENLIATNPCCTGDTLVATTSGWRRADEIVVGDQIATVLGSGIVDRVETYENRPVFKVRFSDGAELRVTAAHKFHAIKHANRAKNSANKRFSELALAELEIGDVVRVAPASMPNNPVVDLPRGWSDKEYGFFVGLLLGDGYITPKTLNRNVVKVAVNTNETEWNALVRTTLEKTGTVRLDASSEGYSANFTAQSAGGAAMLVKQSYLTPAYSFEKKIPFEYQNANKEFLAGLLDGLFSTDGNIDLSSTHPFLRFKTTSKQLAQDIRRILLSFGIHGRIATIKKVADGRIGDRVITSRHTQYEVIISG